MRGSSVAALFASVILLPAGASAQGETRSGKPANMCQELVAFVRPPAAAPTGSPPPQAASAVQAPAQGGAVPQPSASGETQKSSGLSGPTAATGPGAAGPQGATQNGAAPSGAAQPSPPAPQAAAQTAAPAAPPAPPPKKPTPEAIEKADAAARDNDIAACQNVAREMRRAGTVMPAPLMALAAMDLKLLEAGK